MGLEKYKRHHERKKREGRETVGNLHSPAPQSSLKSDRKRWGAFWGRLAVFKV
jgi:hypothetical protein